MDEAESKNFDTPTVFIIQDNIGSHLARKSTEEAELILSPHGLLVLEKKTTHFVSELVRIEDGKRLFWQEHIKYLQIHCEENNLPVPEEDEIEALYHRLRHAQSKDNVLLRMVVTLDDVYLHYTQDLLMTRQSTQGLKCKLVHFDKEDAWDDTKRNELRLLSREALAKGEEYLLVDEDGVLYRGTRNNVYFLFEDTIVTATGESWLNGITRKYIFQAAKEARLKIEEDDVRMSDLRSGVQAAFLASSLLHIVPISQIEEIKLSTEHPLLEKLQKAYFKLLEKENNE